jgi:hypothetical protein
MAQIGWQQPPASFTDAEQRRFLTDLLRVVQAVQLVGNHINIYSGAGTPEGVITANVGSVFLRTDGGVGTTVYAKSSGTGNTGWSALS